MSYGNEKVTETGKADLNMAVFSVFAIGKFSKQIEAIARYDVTADPQLYGNSQFIVIEKGYKTNFLMAGLGWNIHPKFQILPNIKVVSYKENDKGVKPKNFSQFNMTFNFNF